MKESTPMVVVLRAVRGDTGRVVAVKAELSDGNVVTYSPEEWQPVIGQKMRVTVTADVDTDLSARILEAATGGNP